MKLEPLFARVLLERERPEKMGSIIVPDEYQTRQAPTKGKVIAKGDSCDPSIEVGDWVVFGQHAGAWVNSNGLPIADGEEKRLFMCQDEDLMCKVIDE